MSLGKEYLREAYYAIYENDFQKAIFYFKKAIECEPNNPSYYYKLSITYSRNKELKEAIEAAKIANQLLPSSQNYLYHLQILQSKNLVEISKQNIKNGVFSEETEKMLIKAKGLDPLNIEAYILLGVYYGENNLLNKSLNEFNAVLKIEPTNDEARKLIKYYLE